MAMRQLSAVIIGRVGKSNGEESGRGMQPGDNQSACNISELVTAVYGGCSQTNKEGDSSVMR